MGQVYTPVAVAQRPVAHSSEDSTAGRRRSSPNPVA